MERRTNRPLLKWLQRIGLPLATAALGLTLVACGSSAEAQPFIGDYFGQNPPSLVPELFAAGIVSTGHHEHSTAIYSPDMRHLFHTIADNAQHVILYRHRQGENWSDLMVAPFSGRYSDDRPVFTPDGSRLYFESKRPLDGVPESEAWRWWYSVLTETGWSNAQLDSTLSAYKPSSLMFAANNDIYFSAVYDEGFGNADIYVVRSSNGHYQAPENLGSSINSAGLEDGPYLAPDGSYLLFNAFGRTGPSGLYVSFRDADGGWLQAIALDSTVNNEGDERFVTVSPDGKFLFFNSQRNGYPVPSEIAVTMPELERRLTQPLGSSNLGDVYWVDIKILDESRNN